MKKNKLAIGVAIAGAMMMTSARAADFTVSGTDAAYAGAGRDGAPRRISGRAHPGFVESGR